MDFKGIPGRLWRQFKANPEPYLLDLSVALMCLAVLVKGLATVWELSWPCDVDLYRDIGFAQSIRDGHFLSDPLYLGEKIWYNPLVPGLIAAVSAVSGQPVHIVATKLGPLVNLVAPVGFYVMAACLLGRRTAVASTVAYLFINLGSLPSWASATYSPWLFPSNFVQGLFFLGLAAYWRSRMVQRLRWSVVAGALLGLTFLGHTAPALILGSVMLLGTLQRLTAAWNEEASSRSRHQAVIQLFVMLAVALAVSLPYAWSILFHYGLDVKNIEPSSWLWGKIAIFNLSDFGAQNLSALSLLPALGLLGVTMWRARPVVRQMLLSWLVVAFLLFAYTYVWQLLKLVGITIPRIVPGHHFLIYLKALEVLLFGHGLVLMVRYVLDLARYLIKPLDRLVAARQGRDGRIRRGLLLLSVVGALVAAYPMYNHREDFQIEVYKAKRLAPDEGTMRTFRWIQQNTRSTAVFLASDHHTLHLLSAAGRKVVSTIAYFSNPFCDWKIRNHDRHQMFSALGNGDLSTFTTLAKKYHVGHVLVDPSQAINPALHAVLKQQFDSGGVIIYQVVVNR